MDIQLFEETKVEEKKVSFEEETKVELQKESIEKAKIGKRTESFELNKVNLIVFKHLLREAKKWIKQEKIRVKGLENGSREDSPFWKPRLKAHVECLKKAKDELNQAKITQEKYLVKVYSMLLEQGRISEIQSSTAEKQKWEG